MEMRKPIEQGEGENKSVLVISSSYPRYVGDFSGWFIHEIALRSTSDGYDVTSLSPHAEHIKTHELMNGVDIHRFRYCVLSRFEKLAYGSGILYNLRKYPSTVLTIIPFIFAEFFFACRIVYAKRICIIHTHWFVPQGLNGALIHRITGIPHVATVHGSDLNILKKYTFLHPLCRFIVRNSDSITVNSSFMRQQLLDIVPAGADKIRIIPMGVDPERLCCQINEDVRMKYASYRIILSVGRLIDLKGTIFLIDAMPDILKKIPDALLIIIGSGPESEPLEKRIREFGLEEKIIMMGFVNRSDLPSYYYAADVFVQPSLNLDGRTEGLGVVLLEAMALGCPVIGSNVGGIPDIITNGKNGFLIPEQDPAILAEKIILLLSDTTIAEQFRQNGYVTVRTRFSWEEISLQFSEVYEHVLVKYSPESGT